MSETYFTIRDEKGSINISDAVIAAIAGNAVSEMDGMAAFSNTAGNELGELIGKKSVSKGIRVSFQDGEILVDVSVLVRYGENITGVCEKIQNAIALAVESITGVKPTVNVRVAGITFEK